MVKKSKTGWITVDTELCKGCYLCISVCPKNLIAISDTLNHMGYHPAYFTGAEEKNENNNCTGCATCAIICPEVAIEVYRE